MGNSEVGHLTIGSGRVLDQDFQRVNRSVADGSFYENEKLVSAFRRARERGGNVHLLGLVSHGGVHSHIDHLRALLELARREDMLDRTWIHALTDGRDVSPHSAVNDLAELPDERIATIGGRYYAMDRDDALGADGPCPRRDAARAATPPAPARRSSSCSEATTPASPTSSSSPSWRDGRPALEPARDAAIFFNFRPDRARQLSQRLGELAIRSDDDDEVPRGLRLPRRLPGAECRHGSRGGARRARRPPAPHRGDGEVRPRHLLLQRRARRRVSRRDAHPRPLAAGRSELRPQAGDVRGELADRFVSEIAGGLRVRRDQLRQPRHGRAHRRHPRGGQGRRDGRHAVSAASWRRPAAGVESVS